MLQNIVPLKNLYKVAWIVMETINNQLALAYCMAMAACITLAIIGSMFKFKFNIFVDSNIIH